MRWTVNRRPVIMAKEEFSMKDCRINNFKVSMMTSSEPQIHLSPYSNRVRIFACVIDHHRIWWDLAQVSTSSQAVASLHIKARPNTKSRRAIWHESRQRLKELEIWCSYRTAFTLMKFVWHVSKKMKIYGEKCLKFSRKISKNKYYFLALIKI